MWLKINEKEDVVHFMNSSDITEVYVSPTEVAIHFQNGIERRFPKGNFPTIGKKHEFGYECIKKFFLNDTRAYTLNEEEKEEENDGR